MNENDFGEMKQSSSFFCEYTSQDNMLEIVLQGQGVAKIASCNVAAKINI
jgi:hypothetical protein